MGEFRGTCNELIKYINPYIRDVVGKKHISTNKYDIELTIKNYILEKYKPLQKEIYFVDLEILCHHVIKMILENTNIMHENLIKNQSRKFESIVEPDILVKNNNYYDELFKKKEETIQSYVKRLFTFLSVNNLLDDKLLLLLQDKTYCQLAFCIDYPLLIKDSQKIKDRKGHNRYWTKFKLDNIWYVCSEWWKDMFDIYEERLHDWVNMKFIKQ